MTWYGACGVEFCADCLPIYDADKQPNRRRAACSHSVPESAATMTDWAPCAECQHLGVEHAANGPCVAQQELCTCVEFVAVVRS